MTGSRSRRAPSTEKLLLLYDAECKLCLGAVEKLRRIRTSSELVMVPLQQAEPDQLPGGSNREDLLAELHLVDEAGRVYRGADAIVRIMRTIPSLGWLTPLYRLPGLEVLASALYRLIAKHRYRLFGKQAGSCESGACRIHTQNRASKKGDPS